MYQVLYRKWRPETFNDVAGQPHVTTTLKNELKHNRINHAYLFTGSRGTGKTTCAKILAKAVNCLNINDGNPCGKCENCKSIEAGTMLDVVEMDAASNRRIDDIRNLIDEAQFTPAKGKYRVYIIDEVHMLTNEAFNALLKTLEEPPPHVVFILATTEAYKLPATIISRCQRFDFHRINPVDIAKRLEFVANEEKFKTTEEGLLLIAAISDGALRDALSLMDRCIGLKGEVTADIVRSTAGLAQQDFLPDVVNCSINKNCAKALEIINKLYQESKDMARLCYELSNYFRNLMLIKTVNNPREFIIMSDKEYNLALKQTEYLSLEEIVYNMDVLQSAYERMSKGNNSRIELEIAIIKLTSPQLEVTSDAMLNRISALERALNKLKSTAEANIKLQSANETIKEKNKDININSENKTISKNKESHLINTETPNLENRENKTQENNNIISKTPENKESIKTPITNNTETSSKVSSENKESFNILDTDHKHNTDNKVIEKPTETKQPRVNSEESLQAQQSETSYKKTLEVQQPKTNTQETQQPEPVSQEAQDVSDIYSNAERFLEWPEVIKNLRQYSRTIAAAFEGTNAYTSGNYLLIEADTEIPFKLLKQSAQRDNIRVAIQEITGKVYSLGPYKKPNVTEKTKDTSNPLNSLLNDFKNNGIEVIEE